MTIVSSLIFGLFNFFDLELELELLLYLADFPKNPDYAKFTENVLNGVSRRAKNFFEDYENKRGFS